MPSISATDRRHPNEFLCANQLHGATVQNQLDDPRNDEIGFVDLMKERSPIIFCNTHSRLDMINAEIQYDIQHQTLILRAVRKIEIGDEVLINYTV